MLRELINRFSRSVSEQMVSARRRQTAAIKVWFDPDINSELGRERARNACIIGETVDMSKTGIGFTTPAIRVKEKYLVGQMRRLHIEMDLPGGKVYLCGVGRRYEKVGEDVASERYLVGVEITELRGTDKDLYEAFLRRGPQRVPRSTGEIRATAG